MTFNGQPVAQFARNVAWAVVIGSGGAVLVNTVRRDSEKAKRILGYTFVTGLSGTSIGFTFGMMRKKHPIVYSLSTGLGVFVVSGVFFVLRENLLVSSDAHKWRRTFDEFWRNPTITTREEAMTGTQASAISGATTGLLVACGLRGGFSSVISTTLQGAVLGVVGQWSVYKCQQWLLDETIKYHYPELVANAKACDEAWDKWALRKLKGRSYSSRVDEKLSSLEIQLELLQEEEERLLRLKEEQENETKA